MMTSTRRVTPLIKQAGKIATEHFLKLRASAITNKSRYERVTSVDKAIHRLLVSGLPKIVKAPVLSEENSKKITLGSTYWVVDPIDGTTNYITGIPFFCIGIGLVENNTIESNMLYNPFLNELFIAEKGKGAFVNNKKLHEDSFLPLSKSIVGMSYSHSHASIQLAGRIGLSVRQSVHNTRHAGSTLLTMAYVACGRLEAEIVVGPVTPWDTIPGMLLVAEAGGVISDLKGNPYQINKSKHLVASNGTDHAGLIKLIKKSVS